MFREQNIETKMLLEQTREQQLKIQRKNWDRFSAGWKKWDDMIMTAMKPVGDALINSLQVKGSEKILDVASGTGEPGLTLSNLLPNGAVTGTDLSEKMVSIANENGVKRGISNYRSQTNDATKLPFSNNAFDHIICRFGIMFIPDVTKGLGEMARVMNKGGKMAIAVWAAPEKNPFITIMASIIMKKLDLPKPPGDSPGIFRCAQPGYTSQLLRNAGLKDITETNLKGTAEFESAEQYWEILSDVAGPLMQALEKAPKETINEVEEAVITEARNYTTDGRILTPWEAIIVTGVKTG